MSSSLHPTALIARVTRWLQSLSAERPIGMTTVSRFLHRYLPDYKGVIRLPNGIRMQVDTRNGAERALFYAGDRHTAITHVMRQQLQPGAYCIDVGANIGFYTLVFADSVGSQGCVAAFEPNPELVSVLKTNLQLNPYQHVEIVEKAVDQKTQTLTFFIAEDSTLSSLHPTRAYVGEIEVETITLDHFLKQREWPRLDLIKIDIEGHDCQAILGAKEAIQRFRPFIVFEFDFSTDPAIAEECFRFLLSCGYTFSGISIRTGKQFPFDWKNPQPDVPQPVNVLCWVPQ